jgi:hypothetical protein
MENRRNKFLGSIFQMTLKKLHRLIGHGNQDNRIKNDFYPTPEYVTQVLLDNEKFEGEIWEPACGDGAMSEVLKRNNYNVYSTDIMNRNYGDDHFDFMLSTRQTDNIITNPPFKIGTKFTIRALKLVKRKVAIFNKLSFLEGKERRDKVYSQKSLKTVYVFSERVTFNQDSGGMLAFAWFVFDKEHNSDATLKFI